MHRKSVKKATAIVERLGGTDFLAERFHVSRKRIEMWGRRDTIPGRWHLPLLLLADELGVPLAPTELADLPERTGAFR